MNSRSLERDVDTAKNIIDNLVSEIESLEAENKELKDRVEYLETENEDLENKIYDLENAKD